MNILVAEDDENDFCLLQLAFKRTAIPVSLKRTKDGRELIDFLAQLDTNGPDQAMFVPQLLLVDLNMPRATGFDVIRWLRQNPKFDRAIVVILSSSAEPRDVDLAYQMGVNSYLTKPASLERLTELMTLMVQYWESGCQKPHWPRGQEESPGPTESADRLN